MGVPIYCPTNTFDGKKLPLKFSSKANRDVGKDSTDHKIQCQTLVQRFWRTFQKKSKHPLSSQRFYASGGFPTSNPSSEATAIFVLCIHGRLGLEEPLDDHFVALQGCQMQRCFASASPQAEPNGPEGEKNSEKILAPQKSKFWKLWPKSRFKRLEAIYWIKTHELVLYSIEAVSAMLAVKMIWRKKDKLKHQARI